MKSILNIGMIPKGLPIAILLSFFALPSWAQQAAGCFTSSGKPVPCGTRWTDSYNGVEYECYCNCAKTPPAECTKKSSSGSSSNNSGNSKAENTLLFFDAVNSVIDYSNNKDKEAAQRAAELELIKVTEEKRIKEAADQAKYEKEMKSFKPIGNTDAKSTSPEKPNNFQPLHFTCKVVSYSGIVQIKKANGGTFTYSGGKNIDLAIGDILTTGSNGRIKIHFDFEDGGKDLIVDKSSVFKIAVGTDGSQYPALLKGNIHVSNGVLDDIISQAKSEFLETEIGKTFKKKLEIRTPTIICGVRGTEFTISEDSVKGSEIIVLEGSVEMKELFSLKTMIIESGFKGSVTIEGELLGPFEIVLPDVIRWWEQ